MAEAIDITAHLRLPMPLLPLACVAEAPRVRGMSSEPPRRKERRASEAMPRNPSAGLEGLMKRPLDRPVPSQSKTRSH